MRVSTLLESGTIRPVYFGENMSTCSELANKLEELETNPESELFLSDGVSFVFKHNLMTEDNQYIVWEE